MKIDPRAGQPANAHDLVDVAKLVTAYHEEQPDPQIAEQRVVFGTSGHRGSSLTKTHRALKQFTRSTRKALARGLGGRY
jgi:phosphoglucomutase